MTPGAGASGVDETPPLDLARPQRLHVVGVGGAGMSAIATVLVQMGHRVSGSDVAESPVVERVRALGVDVFLGHRATNVAPGTDALIASTAIAADNPEVVAASERGIAVLRRADAMRLLTAVRPTVAVTGTHGKTTTSSMLARILRESGRRPSFVIGGEVAQLGGNAEWADGDWFVVEADESDGTFVELHVAAGLVTNVEADHLEHWGGYEPLEAAFRRFAEITTGPLVVCADDAVAAGLGEPERRVTYGFGDTADYRLADFVSRGLASTFTLVHDGAALGAVEVPVAGRHNALNAAGALTMAVTLGVSFDDAASALAGFGGVARRFEFRGDLAGRTLVDDYAHLPSEIRAAIDAAVSGPWERVVAVFQPHRFSRTATLWREFAHAFDAADVVVLTDIYAAGEAPRAGVSGRLVLDAVLDGAVAKRVVYFPTRADLVRHVPRLTRPGDLVLTLGAGDVTSLADEWMAAAAP